MASRKTDVVIIGAGPYGLSLASYLTHHGIERRIFGFPMIAWHQMPPGMNLKSFGFATSIPTPHPHYTLPEYCRNRGLEDVEPISFATFAEYGEWFQRELVPDVERTHVTRISQSAQGFDVTLETRERFTTRSIIVAAGLAHFTYCPKELASLPKELLTHANDTRTYLERGKYAGRDVTVIGAGQSALEAAALLHEGGAHTRIIARHDVWWSDKLGERSWLERIKNPNSSTGPGRINWLMQHVPLLASYVPTERRVRFTKRHLGPLGAWWLKDRVEGKVPMMKQTSIQSATASNGKVLLRLRSSNGDEHELATDHVIAATGYEYNLDRLPFLAPELAGEIRRIERAPALSRYFESSVAGLYFVGPIAAFTFGPLVRFVAGAPFTTPRVAGHVARRLKGVDR
jgi:FAD-dependent urate hydroxylase